MNATLENPANLNLVLDVPVSCFRSPFPRLDGSYRHLQITAAGSGETRCVLRGMARAGYRSAAVLTHPGEFFERTPAGPVPNIKNRRRWESLLLLLQETGINRLVFISSMGIYDEIPGERHGSILDPYRHAARVIEASDLDFTILRPAWLDNRNEITYGTTQKGEPFKNAAAVVSAAGELTNPLS